MRRASRLAKERASLCRRALGAKFFLVSFLKSVVKAAANERLLLEIKEQVRTRLAALNSSVPIVEKLIEAFDIPRYQSRFLFRSGIPGDVEIVFVRVSAAHKADIRTEIARAAKRECLNEQVSAGLIDLRQVTESISFPVHLTTLTELPFTSSKVRAGGRPVEFRIAKVAIRSCAYRVQREGRLLVEFESAVDAENLVVLLDEIVRGCNHAD